MPPEILANRWVVGAQRVAGETTGGGISERGSEGCIGVAQLRPRRNVKGVPHQEARWCDNCSPHLPHR